MSEKAFVASIVVLVVVTAALVSWRVNALSVEDDPSRRTVVPVEEVIAVSGEQTGCPKGMVPVAEGPFLYGSSKSQVKDAYNLCKENLSNCYPHWFLTEWPQRRMETPFFCIDQFEAPSQHQKPPESGVDFNTAEQRCKGRGLRLCTEYEWEKACRGTQGAVWAYGNRLDENACAVNLEKPKLSGESPACRSEYNAYDMSGNLAEWTDGHYKDFDEEKEGRPRQGEENDRVVRGGSYFYTSSFSRCAYRDHFPPNRKDEFLGYRCCAAFGEREPR